MTIPAFGSRRLIEQARFGQFATSPALALAVAEPATRLRAGRGHRRPIRFLDPALGTGSFFEALLRSSPTGSSPRPRSGEEGPK